MFHKFKLHENHLFLVTITVEIKFRLQKPGVYLFSIDSATIAGDLNLTSNLNAYNFLFGRDEGIHPSSPG